MSALPAQIPSPRPEIQAPLALPGSEQKAGEGLSTGAAEGNDKMDTSDPPLLEAGRDSTGKDISIEQNKLARQKAGQARIKELKDELKAIEDGSHQEVQRQLKALQDQRIARVAISAAQLELQKKNYEDLQAYEMQNIQHQYDANLERAKDDLVSSITQEIKRFENLRDGVKDVDHRMNTRNLRSKIKIDDAFGELFMQTGGRGGINKRRALTALGSISIERSLDEEEILKDLEELKEVTTENKQPRMNLR